MASAFDGLGLSQLGGERRYMTGGPLQEAYTGLRNSLIMGAINKSGLTDYLNSMGKSSKSNSDIGVAPPAVSVMPVNPTQAASPAVPASIQQPEVNFDPIQKQADEAMGIKSSSVGPDLLQQRNSAQDQLPMQMASAPPPQMNFPQQQQGGGSGIGSQIASSILSMIFA